MECRWAILAAATGPKPSFTPTTQRHVYVGIDNEEPVAPTSREQQQRNRTPAKKLIRTTLGTMFIRAAAPLSMSKTPSWDRTTRSAQVKSR